MGEGGLGSFLYPDGKFVQEQECLSFVRLRLPSLHSYSLDLFCRPLSLSPSHSLPLALSLANSCWILSMAVRPKPIEAKLFIERKKVASYKHFSIHAVQGTKQH